jgi:peptidoglycan/LPS O-acetylase OafA/YrhL
MSPQRFRPDVEGLRAIAIGIVLLAHAGVGFAGGGYVGVDVFFVISGFLITQLLVGELDRRGRVCLARFYARRVKRLMPQVLTVIAVVAAVSSVLLSPVRADVVASDVMAAGAYVMNWRLSADAVDYFAASGDRPLDHFWSLAVEEQFYLVWPLVLLAVTWRLRGRGNGGHRALAVALGAVAIASLLYAIERVNAAPDQAYFSAPARAWELALGGLLALRLIDRRLGPRCAAAAAWAGLAAIGAATVAFGDSTPFPGPAALLPTLGAAALLAAGTAATPAAPTRALTLRPLRFVGKVSYAWYVWHWPALVFAAAAWGPLSTAEGLAVVVASFAPTVATHRWIEEPLRRSTLHVRRTRATLAAAVVGPALAVAVGVALSESISSPPALAAREAEGAPQLARTHKIQRAAVAVRPRPRDASADRGRPYYDGCLAGERATTSKPCVYGKRRAKTTVVLFGDSHAMQYFPALQKIALRRHWRLVELTKGGCPPPRVRVIYTLSRRDYTQCDAWREYALRRIERTERPALVIAAASAHYAVVRSGHRLDRSGSTRALADAYAPTLRRLRETVPHVAVLTDSPRPPADIPDCVSRSLEHLRRCAFPRRSAVRDAATVAAGVRRVAGVSVIDPTNRFCLATLCPAVIGDVLVYRNSGHLTASFIETLAPWLARRLPTRLSARASGTPGSASARSRAPGGS